MALISGLQEEVRLAVDTWSQTLLPAHFEAISLCWNESLTKAPIAERARLVAFLIQLHPHFPSWKGRCSWLQSNSVNDSTTSFSLSCLLCFGSRDSPRGRVRAKEWPQ